MAITQIPNSLRNSQNNLHPQTQLASGPSAKLPLPSVLDHRVLTPAHHLLQSNPHSTSRTAHVSHPAVSSFGGFPTPAPEHLAPSSSGRHPKTFTGADIRQSFRSLRRAKEILRLRSFRVYSSSRGSALQPFEFGLIGSAILQLTPSGANTRSTLPPSS